MLKIPTNCPNCESKLELVKDQLYCRNTRCSAKSLQRALKFTKTLKIAGLGEKTLEKLEISNIPDIYNLHIDSLIDSLGEKTGTKIYNEIEKSKNIKFSTFLAAMSIPLIGKTASEKIAAVTNKIQDIDFDLCKEAGLGDLAAISLVDWVEEEYNKYNNLPIKFTEPATLPSSNTIKVCISGKIPGYTKTKIKDFLSNYNIIVKDNVTKDLDYLITQDQSTAKAQKADAYNIEIINFNKFKEILNNE